MQITPERPNKDNVDQQNSHRSSLLPLHTGTAITPHLKNGKMSVPGGAAPPPTT